MIKSNTIGLPNITDKCKLQQDRSMSISQLNKANNLIKWTALANYKNLQNFFASFYWQRQQKKSCQLKNKWNLTE